MTLRIFWVDKMLDSSDVIIRKKLHENIERYLSEAGLLFRVFSRVKSAESLSLKIERGDGKYGENKKIQDLFGVRVVLYFPDDVDIAQEVIKNRYEYRDESSTIDVPTKELFNATRYNLIFKLPEHQSEQSMTLENNDLIDNTFEVQIRTVLSEGWHEVEHDLRYKCKDDWVGHDDLYRALNGILATLETSEWSMLKLFEELSFRHYKKKEWAQMLRSTFRLRAGNELSENINKILDDDNNIGKELFKVDRNKFTRKVLSNGMDLPINLDNLVYICNYFFIKSVKITEITPMPILDELNSAEC